MRTYDDLARALRGVEVVFHQAAFGGFTAELSKYMDVNSGGTARLFEVIREQGTVRKVVAASSQAIYGEGLYRCPDHGLEHPPMRALARFQAGQWESPCPVCGKDMAWAQNPEQTSADGETIYALSKYSEERLTLALGKALGVPSVALRYTVTYGPRQSIYNPYTGVVSIFSTRLLNDLPPVVFEDGHQTRDLIYVGDVAAANLLLMEDESADGEVYDVGTGVATEVLKLVETLAQLYGKDLDQNPELKPQLTGAFRPGDVRHIISDSSKLRALGWAPAHTVGQGLAHYVEWIRSQGDVAEYFSDAEGKLRERGVILGGTD